MIEVGLKLEGSWRDVVLQRRQDSAARLMRAGLKLASFPYGVVTFTRNKLFDLGIRKSFRSSLPVVSVGNLTVGGTGKTPVVDWVCRRLLALEKQPVIVSRGYGNEQGDSAPTTAATPQHAVSTSANNANGQSTALFKPVDRPALELTSGNDEYQVLRDRLPDVPHLQAKQRIQAIRIAEDFAIGDVIVLDDAFQHRQVERNLDIVLLDATNPFGGGWQLPGGLLRESVSGLARADIVVLTRADTISRKQISDLAEQVSHLAPQATWCVTRFIADKLINPSGRTIPIPETTTDLKKKILAAAGIGNPTAFFDSLRARGFNLLDTVTWPDHHPISQSDWNDAQHRASELGAEAILVTHKDLVKIRRLDLGVIPVAALNIELDFIDGEEVLQHRLAMLLHQTAH